VNQAKLCCAAEIHGGMRRSGRNMQVSEVDNFAYSGYSIRFIVSHVGGQSQYNHNESIGYGAFVYSENQLLVT